MELGPRYLAPAERPAFHLTAMIHSLPLRGELSVAFGRAGRLHLPGYDRFLALLRAYEVPSDQFSERRLMRRTAMIAHATGVMESLLRRVRPRVVVQVYYYRLAGLALNVACRQLNILSVDLQHGITGETHDAYGRWMQIPPEGYAMLPAVFWSWSPVDVATVRAWNGNVAQWHDALWGGNPSLTSWFDDEHPLTREFDAAIRARSGNTDGLDILVTCQPKMVWKEMWDGLARIAAASPSHFRWWLRQHPSTMTGHGSCAGLDAILALRGPNMIHDEASRFPLPALLRHSDVHLTATSSSALEADEAGVPTLFLVGDARARYGSMLQRGAAHVVENPDDLRRYLAALDTRPKCATKCRPRLAPKPLADTLTTLLEQAEAYRAGRGLSLTP